MPAIISAVIISYLIGSIPTAYLFTRAIKGVDIRKVGSGNVGATNALRVLGKGWGGAILFIDILKGLLPVVFLGNYIQPRTDFIQAHNLLIIIGLSSICGHNWTIFLGFRGGKGVATTLGVLLGLAFKVPGLGYALSLTVLCWFICFFLSRIISLSSVFAAFVFPFLTMFFKQPPTVKLLGVLLSLFIILRHKPNILRIIKGEEPRFKL